MLSAIIPMNIFADDSHTTHTTLTIAQKMEMREEFIKIGVASEDVDELVEKVQNGEMLDSMKKEYENISPSEISYNDGFKTEKYIYPDGSVKVVGIDTKDANVFTGQLSGGNYTSGSGYYVWRGVKVFATWGIVTASFYANIEGTKTMGRINKIYDYGITVIGGTWSDVSFTITRSNATSTSVPAEARLYFVASAVDQLAMSTFYLRLYVPMGSGAYANFSIG